MTVGLENLPPHRKSFANVQVEARNRLGLNGFYIRFESRRKGIMVVQPDKRPGDQELHAASGREVIVIQSIIKTSKLREPETKRERKKKKTPSPNPPYHRPSTPKTQAVPCPYGFRSTSNNRFGGGL